MAQLPERSASHTTQIANLKHSKTKQTKQNSAEPKRRKKESIPIVVGLEGRLEKVWKYCRIGSSNKAVSRKHGYFVQTIMYLYSGLKLKFYIYMFFLYADMQDVVQSLHTRPKKKLECEERKQ